MSDAINLKEQRKIEKKRVREIMTGITSDGISLPEGMYGFSRKKQTFVRWLPDHSKPISASLAQQNALQCGWFIDCELDMRLKWDSEGFYVMRRRDSAAFNAIHNKPLLDRSKERLTDVNGEPEPSLKRHKRSAAANSDISSRSNADAKKKSVDQQGAAMYENTSKTDVQEQHGEKKRDTIKAKKRSRHKDKPQAEINSR